MRLLDANIANESSCCKTKKIPSMFVLIAPAGISPQKAKSRGGTLVTRAYIKESSYSWNIHSYSQYRRNLDLLEQGPWGMIRNRWVMMTFLLFAPGSTKWLGWRKDRTSPRDLLGRFCVIYCAVILRHSFALRVISDILWSSCFSESYGPKFQRRLLSAEEVIRCV